MSRVIERKTVNIAIDMSVATNSTARVGLNIPFQPDEVIVKSFSFTATVAGDTRSYQVGTDMIGDQVLFCFAGGADGSANLEHIFPLNNFSQNRVWTFQVQNLPIAGTGAGTASTTCQGQLMFFLEFVKYARHN